MMGILLLILSFDPYYFIHYSDPQIGKPNSWERCSLAVDQANAIKNRASFVIVAGDMADNPMDSATCYNQWSYCKRHLDRLLMPYHVAPGNNDIGYTWELQPNPFLLQRYRDFWGPDYYSFDSDSCHIIALNSTLLDIYSGTLYTTSLSQDSFLRTDLQDITPDEYHHLFFFFHYQLYQYDPIADPNDDNYVDRPRRDTLLQDIVQYTFSGIFNGHRHFDWTTFYGPAVLQTGNTTFNNEYRIIKVFDNALETFPVLLSNPIDTVIMVKIVNADVFPDTVAIGISVSFTCVVDSANFPDWKGLTYQWDFGDGDSSTSPDTTHAYSDTGHFLVVFSARKDHERSALSHFKIVVKDANCIEENKVLAATNPALQAFSFQKFAELSLPKAGWVRLDLFQVDGRLVKRIIDGHLESGIHRVNLNDDTPSGIFFLRLATRQGTVVRKYIRIN